MKKTLLSVLLVCACSLAMAQYQAAPEQSGSGINDRLFFGGNFGLSFGNSTFVNVSPIVGYKINDYFSAGGGVNFIYSAFTTRDGYGNKLYTDSYGTAGLGVFARVYPVRFLFAQVRPEMNYVWGKIKYYGSNPSESKYPGKWVPSLLVGGGVAMPAGRGAIMLSLQYDVVQDKRSPYGTKPFVSLGFNF